MEADIHIEEESLEDLLASITPDKQQETIETGKPIGKEVW